MIGSWNIESQIRPAYGKKKYEWWSHEKVKKIGLLADYLEMKKHQNYGNFESSTAVELNSPKTATTSEPSESVEEPWLDESIRRSNRKRRPPLNHPARDPDQLEIF